jgi:hypothetical protein
MSYVPDFNTLDTLNSATIAGTSFAVLAYRGVTSTSTHAISSTGRLIFTTDLASTASDLSFGILVTVSSTVDSANFIQGTIHSFSGNTMSVDAIKSGGSGTYSSWKISGEVAYQLGVQDFINLLNIPQTLFDLDGGAPDSNYGGITPLDAGTI